MTHCATSHAAIEASQTADGSSVALVIARSERLQLLQRADRAKRLRQMALASRLEAELRLATLEVLRLETA